MGIKGVGPEQDGRFRVKHHNSSPEKKHTCHRQCGSFFRRDGMGWDAIRWSLSYVIFPSSSEQRKKSTVNG